MNGSNSKYGRQSYSPTCTSQPNLLRCNEQPELIQHEQYSRTFDHIVEAQSVPALQKQPLTQPPPQPSPHPAPQPAPQPATRAAPRPAPQPALQPSVQHIQNQQCTQHTQPSQVPYASCRSRPDHQAPLYQPSPSLYTQYEPVQAPLTQSKPQNEHYQDVGLLTEFEQ